MRTAGFNSFKRYLLFNLLINHLIGSSTKFTTTHPSKNDAGESNTANAKSDHKTLLRPKELFLSVKTIENQETKNEQI